MPPRKRARLSTTPAATTPAASSPPPGALSPTSIQPDIWAPEQETALFKALLQFKPTGPHKHFRMLSIYNYLHAHGHGHGSAAEHTRIPGIWDKLGSLYDLETLDEREGNLLFASDRVRDEDDEEDEEDAETDGGNGAEYRALFTLPEFGDGDDGAYFRREMWRRRRKSGSEGGSSDPAGPSDLEDEETEEDSKRKSVGGRAVKGGSRGGTRGRSEARGATTRARQLRGREAGSVTSRDTEEVGTEGDGNKQGEDDGDEEIKEEEDDSGNEAADDEDEDGEEEEEESVPARSTRSAQKREPEPDKGGRSIRRR